MLDNKFRNELLAVLQQYHEFCDEHHLTYYLIGGGLIGAIRHQGFIPWDDDIDVAMPREDYEKFLSLKDRIPSGYKVAEPFISTDYSNTMVRMYSTNYKIQQNYLKKFTIGPWIDVFPLDYTYDNSTLRKLHFDIVYLLKILNACKLGGIEVTGGLKSKLKFLTYQALRPIPKDLLSTLFIKTITLKQTPSKYLANLTGRWREKEMIEAVEMNSRSLYDFESIQVYSFLNYDKWLSRVYGEYMTLPPENKRIPDHPVELIVKE